jgi:hypothetical protein
MLSIVSEFPTGSYRPSSKSNLTHFMMTRALLCTWIGELVEAENTAAFKSSMMHSFPWLSTVRNLRQWERILLSLNKSQYDTCTTSEPSTVPG